MTGSNGNEISDCAETLCAIGPTLVEIRACEDVSDARALADAVPDAPAKIKSGFEPELIEDEALAKAGRHGKELPGCRDVSGSEAGTPRVRGALVQPGPRKGAGRRRGGTGRRTP